MKSNKKIDKADKYFQFYTEPSISDYCVNILAETLENLNYIDFKILEPSAGTANFVDSLEKKYQNYVITATDIDPKDDRVRKMDYLKSTLRKLKFKKESL